MNPYASLSPDSISICPCGCGAMLTTREAARCWMELRGGMSKEEIEDRLMEMAAWTD